MASFVLLPFLCIITRTPQPSVTAMQPNESRSITQFVGHLPNAARVDSNLVDEEPYELNKTLLQISKKFEALTPVTLRLFGVLDERHLFINAQTSILKLRLL